MARIAAGPMGGGQHAGAVPVAVCHLRHLCLSLD